MSLSEADFHSKNDIKICYFIHKGPFLDVSPSADVRHLISAVKNPIYLSKIIPQWFLNLTGDILLFKSYIGYYLILMKN